MDARRPLHGVIWYDRLPGLTSRGKNLTACCGCIYGSPMSTLSVDFHVVNYGDNFLIGGRTRSEVAANFQTLRAAICRSSRSRLQLTCKQGVRRVDWGFQFLGYRIKLGRYQRIIEPTARNYIKGIGAILLKMTSLSGPEAPAAFKNLIVSWRSSFSLWERGDNWCLQNISRVAQGSPLHSFIGRNALEYFRGRMLQRLGAVP